MPRKKIPAEIIKSRVYASCDKLQSDGGEEPTVADVAADCGTSCTKAGPLVKQWTDEFKAKQLELRLALAEMLSLDGIIENIRSLTRSVVQRVEREQQAKWAKQVADAKTQLDSETSAAYKQVDSLQVEVKALKKQIADLKRLIKSLTASRADVTVSEKAQSTIKPNVLAEQIEACVSDMVFKTGNADNSTVIERTKRVRNAKP